MEWIHDYLNSEKTLYLFAGMIGITSLVGGLLFLLLSNHRSFAITLVVIGALEMAVMFPVYHNYQKKIDEKISLYKRNEAEFLKSESLVVEKALNSFFWLKLTYGFLILVFIVLLSFLSSKPVLHGIFTALILHLGFAITIDSFGEKITKKYRSELVNDGE